VVSTNGSRLTINDTNNRNYRINTSNADSNCEIEVGDHVIVKGITNSRNGNEMTATQVINRSCH
jgi:hypothetical protein